MVYGMERRDFTWSAEFLAGGSGSSVALPLNHGSAPRCSVGLIWLKTQITLGRK
jgi:hypothetical protein